MRELKFRAWDEKQKQMLIVGNERRWGSVTNDYIFRNYLETHIMQYTGLKDKNGKEIYEGDIVKFGAKNNDEIIGWGEVYWKDNGWVHGFQEWFYNNDIKKWEPDYGMWRPPKALWGLSNVWFEVVGNKFENPELLEQ